ncbi:MAG: S24 family peptidase [Helicobacteraceae bacterium]|jgi:phage repressor protein C with HTH and peptisase S24 domain|nr:S24 family peptidase [Helicobacteraceae bacterium]
MEINTSEKDKVANAYIDKIRLSTCGGGDGIVIKTDSKGAFLFDKAFMETLGLPQYDNIHIIKVVGDGMFPTIRGGDLIMVCPTENEGGRIFNGVIYVAAINGDLAVKRVFYNPKTRGITLKSDNKECEAITFGDGELGMCKIIGRVVGIFNKLA